MLPAALKLKASSELQNQIAVTGAMKSDDFGAVAKPELISKRIYEGFALGLLTMALGAAVGGGAGSLIGLGPLGAVAGAEAGLMGGAIKGQADANKEYIARAGMSPGKINLARFAGGFSPAFAATTILPESGHIGLTNKKD